MAGCASDGSSADTTLPEVTLFTTTTTTTVEESPDPSSSDPDSVDGGTGDGASEDATTTTAPATTTSTVAPTTTAADEPGPADVPLELGTTGLGAAAFGADPEGIIGFVSSFLGGPTADTGYVDPFEFGACPGTQARRVSWGSLTLEFGDASNVAVDRLHFYAYQYGNGSPDGLAEGSPLGLETAEGIGYGSSVIDVVRTYPDTMFLEGDDFIDPNFVVNDNLRGLLTGLTDSDTVTAITGGLPCQD